MTIGLGVILFFAVNTIAATAFGSLKADLTEDGLFTVTERTRDILAAIDQPITLHLYQSAPLIASAPSLRIYSDRVREMLRTYAEIAGETLRIEFIDPQPFSTEEDRAISYGLRGIQLNSTGERGYFGLVGTNSVDGLETVAFLNPTREQFLEYDLTRIVNRLAAASEPKIAVIDGLGIFGDASARRRPSAVLETINSNYDVEQLAQNVSEIPDGIDALLIVHPAIVTDSAQYAIDQYVLRGGPALIFLDPLAENAPANPRNPREPEFPSSNLDRLMRAWGAEMAPAQVVGDRALALRVTATAGPTRQFLEYLPWLQLRRQSLSPDDIVTSELELMRVSSAGALRPLEGSATTLTPLIATTPNSMLFPEAEIRAGPAPAKLLEEFTPSGEVKVMAARLAGPVTTAFPDGPPPPEDGAEADAEPREHLNRSAAPVNLIVVADTDMLDDSHVANERGDPVSNNADFVMNALENLTGGVDLSALRGRGFSFRPFTKIEEMEAAARATYQEKEQGLAAELEEIQQRLAALQMPDATGQAGGSGASDEQRDMVADANGRLLELRRELRDVRAAFARDTDRLKQQLQIVNIGLVPLIVILLGCAVAVWRRVRLGRHIRSIRAARQTHAAA